LTDPPLTTVSQPLEQMTNALAELLLRRISGLDDEDESVFVPTHLVERASA
jgi:DNA-binding LacI/PurR family transcriptional regulator